MYPQSIVKNTQMKILRITGIVLLLITTAQLSFSGVYSFRHYKVEDGLSFNTARNIIQDRDGYIWIGTEDCLNRFDGYNFKIFRSNTKEPNHLVSNYISALFQGSQSLIYIGTDQGISTFNPINEQFARFTIKTADSISINSEINNIVEDRNGNIWISTYGQGAFRYNPKEGQLTQFTGYEDQQQRKNFDMVNFVYADSHNNIWLSTRSKEMLLRIDNKNNTIAPVKFFNKAGLQLAGNIYDILEDSKHNIWLGMWDQGLVNLNAKTGEITFHLSPQQSGGIMHIHSLFEYKPGILMIGSDDGLSIFNTATFNHELVTPSETDPSSLSDKFVYPIFKDREGGIWIGTYFGGVNYLPPSGRMFERYTCSRYANSVNGNIIGEITEDKHGNIWIASDDGGLNVLDAKTGLFKTFLPNASVHSISYYNIHGLCWDDDQLWAGTYSAGLNRYDSRSGQFHHYNSEADKPNTLDGTSVYSVFKDSRSQIWVGTMMGINLYHRATDSFIRMKSLGVTTIAIKEDINGLIWFATWGKGVFRYDIGKNQWNNFLNNPDDPSSIPGNQINCLMTDKNGYLWVGTTAGLCYFDAKEQKFTTVRLNAPSNTICSITDDEDTLWLTTAKGLVRYNKINGNCQVFTKKDGLLSDQFMTNSACKSTTGKIYIGTATGFNVFCPKNIIYNSFIPPVVINRLEIFNKEVAFADYGKLNDEQNRFKQIDLGYKDNVFSLGFVALSYNNPDKNRYSYKLEGFDNNWTEVTNQLKATYTNLPAGNYIFRVKASNNDDVWNNDGASIQIAIHPPIWKTIPFQILYIIIFLVAIVLIIRSQLLRADKKHREKIEQLNHEKEKEVYDAKISFFTMIAHEIRTPVSLIIGPLEKMMATQTALPKEIKKDLAIIDRNSQRLLLLVNQLLDFRKAEQGALIINLSTSNVTQLLKSIYNRFFPLIDQQGIEFVFDCPDKKLEADIDQEFVTKMVSNLLSNALKYANSKIILSCHVLPVSSTFEIVVADDGAGIADSEKTKIFAPFYQINPLQKSGTGIGLSLVKNLVDAHRGSITVTDVQPSGASFAVTLPLHSNEAIVKTNELPKTLSIAESVLQTESEKGTSISPYSTAENPHLLILEDNDEMREFLSESFADEYLILTAHDGMEGLQKIKMAEITIVISDLMMPQMDGLEFCKAIKSNIATSHIPLVLLTAKADLDSKIEGLNYGADAYIEKPFSIKHLKAQIRNLIESRKALRTKYAEMPFVPINSIAANQADEEFLSRMNVIIEKNISNIDFSIDMLAEQLNISRSGFFSKIKILAGVTPNELIQVVRLKKAAELLSGNQYRINEVAYMVGYNDPSYFSKCFFKQFNIRPVDFINKYRSN